MKRFESLLRHAPPAADTPQGPVCPATRDWGRGGSVLPTEGDAELSGATPPHPVAPDHVRSSRRVHHLSIFASVICGLVGLTAFASYFVGGAADLGNEAMVASFIAISAFSWWSS